MSEQLKGTLVLVGCGKMGGAMLEGWLKSGVDAKHIVVLEPNPSPEITDLLVSKGVRLNPAIETLEDVEVLVLAVKPQTMAAVLEGLKPLQAAKPLILSIAAGKTIAGFEAAFGSDASVIRSIPNTPAAIGRGITAMVGNTHVSRAQMELAESLMASTGEVVQVPHESMIDLVTAVSGSGPAYVFLLAEALAAAGEKVGLPKDLATKLARATVSGSGELMRQSGIDAATLRQNVTSPNGTTYAALQVLMSEQGLQPLLEKAVAAAASRSRELAG
jgi:pyrroline-5-carboxylate reductase